MRMTHLLVLILLQELLQPLQLKLLLKNDLTFQKIISKHRDDSCFITDKVADTEYIQSLL